ncbi:MAG: ABC transporter ATP-binding protein [Clostridia bacterium]|nr:ABC transporter ATP-binding protein [Clostridia bacterium]
MIETKNLTKFYGKNKGIEDVSLSIQEGDFFGFIGPNGAGKSTTIRTLLGLLQPTSGSATIFGKDIVKEKTEILKDVGYLPSEASFYRGMRVKEVLEYSAKVRGVDCTEEADRLCERLELDTQKRVEQLSLGNRKKVGIVCALQHKPKLYVLDEPTSGLDPLMQKAFYSLLEERNKEGATIFLSSHILSEVGQYCKHAAVIRSGNILVSDSVENLGHTGVKRVALKGVFDVSTLKNIRNIQPNMSGVSFLFDGDINDLIKQLGTLQMEDVSISNPSLEEVFMHYYGKGE